MSLEMLWGEERKCSATVVGLDLVLAVVVVHMARSDLVPRSHSVTGNVRSGKVRQYTVFHWLLKKVAVMQSTLRLAYFAGQAHVLF